MNVLYILGNGFDLAQGMKTSYPYFYQYLMKKECSPLLELMKKDIIDNVKLWSDMEKALGNYTLKLDSEDQMDKLHEELCLYLQNYLKTVESEFKPDSQMMEKIKMDFRNPEEYLTYSDYSLFNGFLSHFPVSELFKGAAYHDNIDYEVMTFNYTNTFEKLIGDHYVFDERKGINLNRVYHVHGQLDKAILLGVNDTSQIANVDFRNSDIIKSFFVKEKGNDALKNGFHTIGRHLIETANIVVLFGVSFGDTDKLWWDLLGNQLKNREDIAVISFLHCDNRVRRERPFDLPIVEADERQKLYSKLGIEYPSEKIDERFFIAINTDMFCVGNLKGISNYQEFVNFNL